MVGVIYVVYAPHNHIERIRRPMLWSIRFRKIRSTIQMFTFPIKGNHTKTWSTTIDSNRQRSFHKHIYRCAAVLTMDMDIELRFWRDVLMSEDGSRADPFSFPTRSIGFPRSLPFKPLYHPTDTKICVHTLPLKRMRIQEDQRQFCE